MPPARSESAGLRSAPGPGCPYQAAESPSGLASSLARRVGVRFLGRRAAVRRWELTAKGCLAGWHCHCTAHWADKASRPAQNRKGRLALAALTVRNLVSVRHRRRTVWIHRICGVTVGPLVSVRHGRRVTIGPLVSVGHRRRAVRIHRIRWIPIRSGVPIWHRRVIRHWSLGIGQTAGQRSRRYDNTDTNPCHTDVLPSA